MFGTNRPPVFFKPGVETGDEQFRIISSNSPWTASATFGSVPANAGPALVNSPPISANPVPIPANSGSIPDIDITKRHCKCNQPYDPKKFYIGCDICFRWFHGKCVGISEKKSKKMTSWTCDDCVKEQKSTKQELFCLCQTPYDDTRFYVGCDGCEGWFHPQCVGITQEDAENAAEYLCPQCARDNEAGHESTTLNGADFVLLQNAVESLKNHRTSWPFREAVDRVKHPNYYSIIKKPMDLSIVQRKIKNHDYRHLKEFTADIAQIFENARTFNPKNSAICQCADILEKHFRERIMEVKSALGMKVKQQTVRMEKKEQSGSSDQLMDSSGSMSSSVSFDHFEASPNEMVRNPPNNLCSA